MLLKQSTAIDIPVFMGSSLGAPVLALLDAGFTKRISKNGAAFAAMTVTITELENGWYSMPLSAAHTDTNGALSITLIASGALNTNMQHQVTTRLLDDLATPTNITAGTITTVTTVTGLTAADVGAIKTKTDFLPSVAAGAAGGVFIAGTNAATTITTALTTTFTGNLTGSVASVTGAVGSVTGLTASNLDATISSRMATYTQPTGFLAATFPTDPADQSLIIAATNTILADTNAILIDTAEIGAAGAGLTAINLPNQTMDITGNITGNLSGSVGSVTGFTAANIATIMAKTDALPSDPADASVIAGRFDTLDTSVADLPTNAEIATALGTADDAVLAAVAALNDFDPTTEEVLANVKKVNDITVTGAGTPADPWGP